MIAPTQYRPDGTSMTIISADIAVMAVSRFQGLCIRISVILFFVFNSARDRIGDEQQQLLNASLHYSGPDMPCLRMNKKWESIKIAVSKGSTRT